MSTTITGVNFVKVNFDEQINGSDFKGKIFQISITDENGTSYLDLRNAEIDTWFRRGNAKGSIVKKINITNGITILDDQNGKFQFDSFYIDWGDGLYYYDIRIKLQTGEVSKYVYGEIVVKEDSTDN